MERTRTRKILTFLIVFILGFLLGIEFKAYQARQVLSESFSSLQNPQTAIVKKKEAPEPTKPPVVISKKVGDLIPLTTMEFKVIKVLESTTLSSSFGSLKVAKEGAKFLILDVEIKNLTNTPFYFSYTDDHVFDSKEREYLRFSETFDSNEVQARTLSPNIVEKGIMVYEVSKDSTGFYLPFGKAGTNEIYKIILNNSSENEVK